MLALHVQFFSRSPSFFLCRCFGLVLAYISHSLSIYNWFGKVIIKAAESENVGRAERAMRGLGVQLLTIPSIAFALIRGSPLKTAKLAEASHCEASSESSRRFVETSGALTSGS